MTIGQRIFYLLEKKHMTQREFSARTGIATTTISDWRKKNTNPGAEKIMAICAALDVTPYYLLSGVTEDSERGKNVDYMIIPKGTEERELIELFNDMDWINRKHLLELAHKISYKSKHSDYQDNAKNKTLIKIAEFCDIEIFIDSSFKGKPSIKINYIDDDIQGSIDLMTGQIKGDFSKYVVPVINAWYQDNKEQLTKMWNSKRAKTLPAWE